MDKNLEETIRKMSPNELLIVKTLVNSLLIDCENNRNVNIKYLEKKDVVTCPNNPKHKIKKNGKKNNVQRYLCLECNKGFSITNHTILNSSGLSYFQLINLLKGMYDYKSIKEISQEIGISETAVFEVEIKFFEALDQLYDIKLGGQIQIDEKYIRTSFKGTPKSKMPRPSRHDGHTNLISGISKDQICVIVAIDENDNILIKVVGNGSATNEMIETALKGNIKSNSIIITDSKNSYEKFAKDNECKLIQIPSGQHQLDTYTINDVNELMQEISSYLYEKKGVSSRHLQHHMNFIKYRKIIKYTIEYLEINSRMYNDIITININLLKKKVYTTKMPFNIEEYKMWYIERKKKKDNEQQEQHFG